MGLISSIKKVVSKITGQDNNKSGSSNTTTHTEIKYSTPPWNAPKSQPSTPVKQDSSTLKQGNGPVNTINEVAKQAVTLPKNTSTSGSRKSGNAVGSGNTDKWSRMSESQQQEQKAVSKQEHAQYEAKQQNQETKTERSARFRSSSPGSFGATEPGSRFESFKRFPTLGEVKKREEEKNPQPQPGAAPQVPEPSVPPVVPDLNRYPGNTTVRNSGKGVLSEAVTKADKDPFNTELSAYAVARDPQILYENDNWDFYNDFKNNQAKNKTFNYFGAQMDAQKHTTPGIFGKGTQFEEGYVPDNPHFYGYNYEPQTHEANEYKEEAKPYIAAGLIVPGLFNSDEPRIVKREYSRSAHGGVMYDTVIYTDEKGKKIELIRGSAHEDEYNTRFLSSFMTESEQSAYYYLRGRYGEDRSDEYIKQLSKALETRALDADTAERYYDIGKNDPIVARITSLLGGYAKIADFVQAGYKDFTNQTPEHSDYNVTTALNALEAGENEGHGAIYRFINGAVNGALENAGFAPLELIPGIGHGAAIAANFAAAAGEKYGEMISSGTFNKSGSTANMITYGVINAVEYGLLGKAFSTPLSQLAKIGPQTAVKSTIVNSANLILSNLGIGATQSFLSSIADTALMGDNSTYNQLIRKYRDEGKTEADAREQAVKDIASGIGQAALAAGLIGTVFGIKNIANEGISFNVRGAALEQSGKTIYDVLNDANATGANSAARKNAAKIRAGLDNGSITPDMYREVMGAQDILNQIDIARQDTYRQRMQELTGLKIGEGQVDERVNGAYRDGVVAVSPTAQIPREEVITHEGQHAAGTKEYHDAVQSIEGFQNAVERVINNYKDQGMTISRKVAEDEVASMVAQNFTQNVKDVERLIRYAEGNPKVADKIYNGLRDLRARVYAKGGRVVYDEKTGLKIDYDELRNLEKLWENAITTVRERGYNNVEGELRYSFAGERAKAADSEALTKAKRMECDGASPEEIWRETGWGKGLDGKWRFEIGNSGAEFNKQGFTENPDILRKRELTDKFLNAAISDEEMQELQSLNSATSGVRKPTKLSDYFKNKELFEAYPELGDIPVKFEKLEKGTHGSYNPGTNSITLNSFDSAAQNKQTLIHEIQHAIQNYEGFAGGSSPSTAVSMDAYRNTAGEIEARDAASRIDMTAEDRRTSFPESMKPNDNVVFSLKRSGGADEKNSNIYDYTKSFEEQIDDWKQGKIPKYDTLLVGGTPEVLKKIGFNALPVTINQTHIDYALNNTRDADHSLGESVLKQLPDKIKNPIAVISSKTHPDTSVVVLLDFQHNGKTVVAPVEIDGYGRQNNLRIDSNAVKSIYAKDNAITKQLSNAIKEYSDSGAGVYYINTKKAAALLQRAGLQLPGGLFLNNGYTDSIAYTGLKVNAKLKNNTYSQQFKRWFGDWEKSPNTASKVVNDDGTPKVVYHGTSRGGFTEFDTYFYLSKYGLFGNGAYFTESHSIADAYTHKGKGENPQIYEAYLNIKNPIDMDAAADVSLWNKALENADYFERAEPGDTNEQVFRKIEEELADNYIPTYEGEEFVRYLLEAMGYDGITHIGGGRVNSDSEKHRVWIAFKPEQIKSATDNIGTFDSSNPDIRYSAKKISDTSKWGTNIDRDVTEFASGLGMNKTIWKRAGKTDVKELIRDAYRLYDENNNTEAQAKLRDAGSMIADSIKLKRGQIIDVNSRTNIINNFVAEFEKNYQQGKTNLIMREARPQDTSDRQNYGIGVNKYVRDVMRSIGVEPNQINEAEEKAVREAFENLKTGDEESARNALDAVARDIYSRARAELLPNERAFMDAVRDSSLDLSSYTDTGELADGDLERLRQITGGSKNGRSTVRSAPDQAYKELSSLFPEFLPPDAGGDPARNILDAYNRIEEKISEPRYGLNDIIAGAENFKDKVITDYRYAQPAAKNTAVEQKNYDTEKYGSDIEASFRDIMSDVTEGEVKRSSQIVRKTLDGIIDGDEIWDDPLSAYDELARNIDETVQQITRGRNRSTDEKQRLAIQIMQSVCDNADSALALAKERTRDQQIKAAIEG
ncbi:MAG: LPD23 domain-containing protein, partial [Candidatus Ornithomonoglobus sp.]